MTGIKGRDSARVEAKLKPYPRDGVGKTFEIERTRNLALASAHVKQNRIVSETLGRSSRNAVYATSGK
jgi:hypothetical protein